MTVMMENPIATHGITETNAAIVNGSPVTLAAEPFALESDSTKSEKFKPDVHFWLAFSPLTVLVVMVALDGTSLSVALPVISNSLHGTAIEAFWTGTSFLLSSTVFQLPTGALSDIFGRRVVLTTCTIFFLVGIIIASVANDFITLLVGRTIQGVGGGGIILLNRIIITDLIPLRQQGAYLGITNAMWALGSVTGPVIGGALASAVTWRWIFWINIPFAVISLVLVPLFLRLKRPGGSIGYKLKRVDWIGTIIFVVATTCVLVPLTWAGVQSSWSSWQTLVPLILGTAGLIAFYFYEWRVPAEPIFRIALLRNYNLVYSLLANTVDSIIVYSALYFLPLYFEGVQGYTPVIAGVALFPATFTVAPMAIVAGVIISKTNDFRAVTWAGWLATTVGSGACVLLDVGTSVQKWFFLTFTTGLGLGLLYTSLAILNQAAADDHLVVFAISLFIFARMMGQALGVSLSGLIFQNRMRASLLKSMTLATQADEFAKDASSLVVMLRNMPAGQTKQELRQAYADSLKVVWAVMCALSGIALIGSVFLRKTSLEREHRTEHGVDRKA